MISPEVIVNEDGKGHNGTLIYIPGISISNACQLKDKFS
jgi:hypothetical protein